MSFLAEVSGMQKPDEVKAKIVEENWPLILVNAPSLIKV